MNLGFSGPIEEREALVPNARAGSELVERRARELNELLGSDGGIAGGW